MELRTSVGTNLPEWARFLINFGETLTNENPEKDSWHVFTMPTARMASALLGIGFMAHRFRDSAFHKRDGLDALSRGDQITWLSHDFKSIRHGYFESVLESEDFPGERVFEYVDSESGPTKRQAGFFDTYRFSRYEGSPFKRPRQLSKNVEFLDAFAPNMSIELATKSSSEVCFIGEVDIRADLLANELSCDGNVGSPDDILRVRALDDVGESPHHLSLYVNPIARSLSEISTRLAIYDGSAAVRRQSNYVEASTSVVILERWDNHSREVIAALKNMQMRSRGIEKKLPNELQLPQGMEYLGWDSYR